MSKRLRAQDAAEIVDDTKHAGADEGEEEHDEEAEPEDDLLDEDEVLRLFVSERSDEELLTIFSTCRETMRNLRKQFLHEVKPLRDTVNGLKADLLQKMNDKALDALQVEDKTYLRRVLKQGNGRKLISSTFADVLDALCTDAELVKGLLQDVQNERQARLDKWTAKQKRAKRGKLGPRATLEAQVVGFAPPPPDPGPRVFGKNKIMRRKLTPISRDMSVGELAAEIAYQAVHQAHRPLRHVLNVTKTLGRGKNSAAALALSTIDDIKSQHDGAEIASSALRFVKEREELAGHSRALSEQRTKHRRMLNMCQQRITEYISTLNPGGRVVRRCFQTESGPCTVSIAVKTREQKARTLTLWDVSEAVDSIAETFVIDGADATADEADTAVTPMVAQLQACLSQIREKLAPHAEALLETRVKTVERVMDRRVRPKQTTAPPAGHDGAANDTLPAPAADDGADTELEDDEEYVDDEEDEDDDDDENLEDDLEDV